MPRTIISRLQENPDLLRNAARKKTGKKKTKFKKVTFKITDTQKEALEVICRRQKTTPIRFLKSVIKKHTARYKPSSNQSMFHSEKQLQLFDFSED